VAELSKLMIAHWKKKLGLGSDKYVPKIHSDHDHDRLLAHETRTNKNQ
jgi:hypothetical protein